MSPSCCRNGLKNCDAGFIAVKRTEGQHGAVEYRLTEAGGGLAAAVSWC